MLDIRFIRENADLIKLAAKKKRLTVDVDKLLSLETRRRELLLKVEQARAAQNLASEKLIQADETSRAAILDRMQKLKISMATDEEDLSSVMKEWKPLMLTIPNIPDISVPEGESDLDNMPIRGWGEVPNFTYPPKDHIAILTDLGVANFDKGSKASGFRGYFMEGELVTLNLALWRMTYDFFVGKGYYPMMVPMRARREAFVGTGYLPQGEEDLFRTSDGELFSGTAEVLAMSYFMDDVLGREKLPMKILAFSPCLRREAGSYGKAEKGLYRVHEFYKWEQIVLCESSHEKSVELHEEITKNAEELMQLLEIPYRVVVNCGADLGLGQVKKHDIEAWLPSERKYKETHSASYFHDFQTRRLGIRYKDESGQLKFAHSLNNTALATPRILISLVENHQKADGTVNVPSALRPYFGKDQLIGKTQ